MDPGSKRRLGGAVAQQTDAKSSKYHHGNLREALIGNAVKILEEEVVIVDLVILLLLPILVVLNRFINMEYKNLLRMHMILHILIL